MYTRFKHFFADNDIPRSLPRRGRWLPKADGRSSAVTSCKAKTLCYHENTVGEINIVMTVFYSFFDVLRTKCADCLCDSHDVSGELLPPLTRSPSPNGGGLKRIATPKEIRNISHIRSKMGSVSLPGCTKWWRLETSYRSEENMEFSRIRPETGAATNAENRSCRFPCVSDRRIGLMFGSYSIFGLFAF